MRVTKKPVILVGAISVALSGLASLDNLLTARLIINQLQDSGNPFVAAYAIDLISSIVLTLGCLGLAIWAFVAKTARPLGIASLALLVLGPVTAIGVDMYWMSVGADFGNAFFQTWGGAVRIAAASAVFTALIGTSLLAFGALTNKPARVPSVAVQNRFDPMTGQPIVAPVATPAGAGAPSNMPLIALILAFFVPLAAVIVGHISLNQMKQGLISSANLGMAKAGLILGYVFTGLSFMFGIIFAVAYVTVLSRQYY